MEQFKRAALAPTQQSSQDRRVAADAQAKIQAARQKIQAEKREELAEQTEKRRENEQGEGDSIGQADQLFNPEERFDRPVGGLGRPLGTGLAGKAELNVDLNVFEAGELFNMVA